MKATTLTLLFLFIFGLSALLCAGRVGGQGERCLCRQKIRKHVKPQNVKAIEVFTPSPSCSKTEILITMKKGKKVCLDPKGKQGKNILQGKKGMTSKSQGGRKRKKNQQ
ncbi:hypothetical protein NFI96_013069 [Prochilodus magdalenae]|nr:hypothetical protein NFI96_013069 [Prochilodus magdalenae]